jgi:hypothetical protein
VQRVIDFVLGIFDGLRSTIGGVLSAIWAKVQWVVSQIPDTFLPGALQRVKYGQGGAPAPGRAPVGGQLVTAATASATERARPRPMVPHEAGAMPAFAAAAVGGGGSTSIVIQSGAIQISAMTVDQGVIRQIDYELGRLLRRRMERR